MRNLDNTDRQLLPLLRKNARTPVVNLAKELIVPGQWSRTGSEN
ncbi:AsnC family transcriptional regulator [Psychromonas sp. MB-3u-54]